MFTYTCNSSFLLSPILILILYFHLLLELVRHEGLGENVYQVELTPTEPEADDPCRNIFPDSVVG